MEQVIFKFESDRMNNASYWSRIKKVLIFGYAVYWVEFFNRHEFRLKCNSIKIHSIIGHINFRIKQLRMPFTTTLLTAVPRLKMCDANT